MIILSAFIFTIEMGIKDTYNGGDSSPHALLYHSLMPYLLSTVEDVRVKTGVRITAADILETRCASFNKQSSGFHPVLDTGLVPFEIRERHKLHWNDNKLYFLSLSGLTRQSTTIQKPYGFWIPAFAGMTFIV
jgi:hypothetical protein